MKSWRPDAGTASPASTTSPLRGDNVVSAVFGRGDVRVFSEDVPANSCGLDSFRGLIPVPLLVRASLRGDASDTALPEYPTESRAAGLGSDPVDAVVASPVGDCTTEGTDCEWGRRWGEGGKGPGW